jgi:hypothetical protein
MGGSSIEQIKLEIENQVNTNFSNMNKNINDMINNTITNVTNQMINETATEIRQSTSGSNIIRIQGNINLSNNAVFSPTQIVDIKSTNEAVVKIVNDSEALKELQNKITGEVMNKIMNDSATQAQLKAVNELTNKKVNEGGDALIGKAFDALASIANSITGADTEKSISQKIMNKIGIDITNTNINENYVKNLIENNITTIVKNLSTNNCNLLTTGGNELIIEGDLVMSDNAVSATNQVANVVSLNKCMIDQSNSLHISEKLANSSDTLTTTDTTNKSKAEATMDTKNKAENADEQKSAFVAAVNAFARFGAIIGVVVVIGLCVGLFIFLKNGGTLPNLNEALQLTKINLGGNKGEGLFTKPVITAIKYFTF